MNWIPEPLPAGLTGLLAVTAAVAAFTDIRWRRIPNWLILPALVMGLIGNLWLRGWPGVLLGLGGFALAALVYVPLFALKGIGAGDVKLMAALGMIVGPKPWLLLLLVTSITAALSGVVLAQTKGRLPEVVWNFLLLVKELASFRVPHRRHEQLQLHHEKAIRMPHGVAVAVGTLVLIVLMHAGLRQG